MLADLNQSSVSFQKKIQHDTTLSRPAAGQYTPPQSTAPCHPISFLRKVPSSYPVAVVGTIWYHGYTETSVVQLTIFRYGDLITFCRRRVRHEPCWDDSLYQTTSQNLFSSLLCHWLSCEKFHPQKMACPMTVVPDRLEKFPCSTAKSQLATYKLILGRPKNSIYCLLFTWTQLIQISPNFQQLKCPLSTANVGQISTWYPKTWRSFATFSGTTLPKNNCSSPKKRETEHQISWKSWWKSPKHRAHMFP